MNRKRLLVVATLLGSMWLTGCSTFSSDGGMNKVSELTQGRIGQAATWLRSEQDNEAARQATRELLVGPLSADDSVKVALLNNRGLQAAYADLGIAESDLVQAGRLVNPGFTFSRSSRSAAAGNDIAIERAFLVNVLGLITLPLRTALEQRRFALTQGRVAGNVLQVTADTRRAWVAAVAAQESASYAEQVKAATEASAELARRMVAAGNFSKLDHAREQVFYAEATAQLARARQSAVSDREQLTRLMGLWGNDTRFTIPARLPDLPASVRELTALEAQAVENRLDVMGAMQEAENLAATLGLTRATGFINVLEVGYRRNSETGLPPETGYEIELRLPLFDWGGAKVARAEHSYMQAVNRAADIAVHARSEVREAYSAYRTAYELARHYREEIVPLRKHISEEVLLRYNGMLISAFELLADARQQISAVTGAINAQRDFWIADTNLTLALTGGSPGSMTLSNTSGTAGSAAAAH